MHKIIKIILVILSVAGTILWVNLPSTEVPYQEAVNSSSMNLMFTITFIFIAISVLITLFFGLKNTFSSPSAVRKTLMGVGGLLVVVLFSYGISSGTDIDIVAFQNKTGIETNEGTIKYIGTFLNIFFILTIIALVLMVVPSIKRIFNK